MRGIFEENDVVCVSVVANFLFIVLYSSHVNMLYDNKCNKMINISVI